MNITAAIIIMSILLIGLAFVLGYYLGSSKIDKSAEKELTEALLQYQRVQNFIHQNGIL